MSVELFKSFVVGMTDYIARHNSNYALVEQHLNQLLTYVSGQAGGTLAVPVGLQQIFDRRGVDGAVDGVSDVIMAGGRAIRRAQTGQLQLYGLFIGIGLAIIALCVYFFG